MVKRANIVSTPKYVGGQPGRHNIRPPTDKIVTEVREKLLNNTTLPKSQQGVFKLDGDKLLRLYPKYSFELGYKQNTEQDSITTALSTIEWDESLMEKKEKKNKK